MVISRTEAERDFPGVSPLGKRVQFQGRLWEVVGVVGDAKYATLSTDDRPTVYTSAWQRINSMALQVRTSVDPGSVTGAVREALRDVAPDVPPATVETMTSLIRNSSEEERYRTTLMSLFGIMAAVLAAVGMYGVTSRAVGRRTREIGIRVALGATSGGVARLFARQTLAGMAAGVAVGLVISLVASRALEPFLFGIAPHDATAYVGSVALLAAIGLVASWLPARRVSRVQPAVVLKSE
jgi:ABC-type antimicrobial peptide transport system permease subunit